MDAAVYHMTTSRKPAIPSTQTLPPDLARIIAPIKENVEILTGVRHGTAPLSQIPTNASLNQIIAAINAIIIRLNATGQ